MNALAFAPYVSQATLDTVHEAVESGYDESSDFEDDDSWGMSTSECDEFPKRKEDWSKTNKLVSFLLFQLHSLH